MTGGDLDRALAVLARGGVVAAATETFFGLLADARSRAAIGLLYAIKRRDENKGIALLLPDRGAWAALVQTIPPIADRLADRFWPGPLTIALAARPGLDPHLVVDGAVAVRLGGPSDASDVARAFGAPLTATSANLAGGASCTAAVDVERYFPDSIERGELSVVSGHASGGAPSTLVAVDAAGVRIVRTGRIADADIRAVRP